MAAVGKLYERNGRMMTIRQIAKETGLHVESVRRQIKKYGNANTVGREQAQESPPPLLNGRQYTWTELGMMAGISTQAMRDRILRMGMSVEDAVFNRKYQQRAQPENILRCSEKTKQEILKLWDCGERSIEEVAQRSGVSMEIISVVLPVEEILREERRDVLRKYGYVV